MTYLSSRTGDGLVQARQVAEHLEIPTDSALKILQTLARNGLIQSQLGRSGGYQFHRRPEDITLLEIVEAIDGPISAQVPIHGARQRVMAGTESLRRVYEHATRHVRAELERATVATLASETQAAGEPTSTHMMEAIVIGESLAAVA